MTERRWGAFHGTSLDLQLRDLGVTQVFSRLGETATTAEIVAMLERTRVAGSSVDR